MPNLNEIDENPRTFNDQSFTSFEKRNRETMRIRPVRYGFFRVATEPVVELKCMNCTASLPINHLVVNGQHFHNECFNKSCRDV